MPDLVKLNTQVEALTRLVGGFIPLVGAVGTIIELVHFARPSEEKKAQEFDAAMAVLTSERGNLRGKLDEFHALFPETAPPVG